MGKHMFRLPHDESPQIQPVFPQPASRPSTIGGGILAVHRVRTCLRRRTRWASMTRSRKVTCTFAWSTVALALVDLFRAIPPPTRSSLHPHHNGHCLPRSDSLTLPLSVQPVRRTALVALTCPYVRHPMPRGGPLTPLALKIGRRSPSTRPYTHSSSVA